MSRMCIRVLTMLLALFAGSDLLRAQQVRLGDCTFEPEANVASRAVRSVQTSHPIVLGVATGRKHNVLLQFYGPLSEESQQRLARLGVELSGYLGGNAYWAQLPQGMNAGRVLGRYGARSVMGTRPEWKASGSLLAGDVPAWARRGVRGFAFELRYASNASASKVREDLVRLGAQGLVVKAAFRYASGELPVDSVRSVAALDYVQVVAPVSPQSELENYDGASLSGAFELASPALAEGRGLTGAGIRAGVWDGNVEVHPDFSDRVWRMEFESESGAEHATHVVGTLCGSGLLDARGRGMAPGLRVWTYNFGMQKNGMSEWEEMAEARRSFGITLTQHSYGFPLQKQHYKRYLYLQQYMSIDQFAYDNPTVVNVYSAGNDQSRGGEPAEAAYGDSRYGTSTKRAKNVLHIGAVGADGGMTSFSSWGPMDDGRMLPTVCAKGEGVYSTKPGGSYQQKDGTSMACPMASGHIALIQERYRQINGGEDLRSDLLRAALATGATDAGNKGPDYSYGFGILNAVKTVKILENQTYYKGEFAQAATAANTYRVRVPAGVKSMRVTLAWIDPVVVKEYAYGDSPMVQDLDLSVSANGVTYLPLVCDPKHPAKPAEQRIDRLNNTEQVVVDDLGTLAGQDVTITVTPRSVAQGAQVYYVAYHFERDAARIVSPRNGDELAPGEVFYLRLEGVTTAYEAEISTDGGKSYRHLGRIDEFDASKPYCSNVKVHLPERVAPTQQAKIRIITADGMVAESEGYFTIAPGVSGVTMGSGACGSSEFTLRWKAAGVASQGYVVLRGEGAKGGVYEKIAEVAEGVAAYTLKPEDIVVGACYTVACKRSAGWGRRAPAVQLRARRPIVISPDALPWVESFQELDSPYFSVLTGPSNTHTFRASDDSSMPIGTHMHLVSIGEALEDFDIDNPFSDGHKKNLATYEFCGLDLRKVPSDQTLMLRLRVGMRWAPVNATRGPWFRVLLDGKPLRDAAGVEVHERLSGIVDVYYPIVGGGAHALSMQFVGKYNIDRLYVYQLAVEANSVRRDVGLSLVSMPQDAAGLSAAGRVVVRLCNKGGAKLEGVGLQVLRNGQATYRTVVEALLPHERRMVALPVDISTTRPLGEVFNVAVRAELPGDEQPSDNSVDGAVKNRGSVFSMPRGDISISPMGPIPIDPKKVYRLEEGQRLLFTDDGGALGDYYSPQVATLKIFPSRKGRVVRVQFKEFSCDGQGAHLLVYTRTVPDGLDLKGLLFDKELIGTPAMPYSAVSRADDGALTFYVEAHRPGKGWLAEIDEVPVQNALTVVSATAVGTGDGADGKVPVRVAIRNNYERAVDGISLHYYLDEGHEGVLEGLKLDAKEEKVFEFPQKVELKTGVVAQVSVWLCCQDDSDGEDNAVTIPALYDAYPIPARLSATSEPSIGKLEYLNGAVEFRTETTVPETLKHFSRYQLSDTIALYKGVASEPIRLVNLRAKPGDVVRLWIDWDGNRQFGPGELAGEYVVEGGAKLSEAKIATLEGFAAASQGDRRARIAVGDAQSLSDPGFTSGLKRGCTYDFIVKVVDKGFPSDGDLQLSRIELQTPDGKPLTIGGRQPGDAKVILHVKNLGHQQYLGTFKVAVRLDGVVSEEVVDMAARSLAGIPAFGKEARSVSLDMKVNLSQLGRHDVRVTIDEQPATVNARNNTASEIVYACEPENKNYALAFRSLSEEFPECLKIPKGASRIGTKATLEFWAFLRESGFNTFLETDELMVCSFYKMKEVDADNSLGIVLREGFVHTGANTLLPGRWNHIAIVLDEIKRGSTFKPGSCKVTAYINGERQELVLARPDGTNKLDAPRLGTRLNGMLDEFRQWSSVRTQDEIKANMYRHLPEKERKGLVYEFPFSEGVGNKYVRGVTATGALALAELVEASAERLQKPGELWYRLAEQPQLVEAKFEGQVKVEEKAAGFQRIYFKKGTDLSSVTANFVTAWPCARVLRNGKVVPADTPFNLAGGNSVELAFESELFGEKYLQTVRFEGVEDANHECDLLSLSLPKDENPGLTQDLTPVSLAPSIELMADVAPSNPAAVKLRFTLSPGAKLFYHGKALSNGASVDLSVPALLKVVAENGRSSKQYSVRLSVANRIESPLANVGCTYGDNPQSITIGGGIADAPWASTSTEPSVASFAGGKLRIGKPGAATVTLWQRAMGIYRESNRLQIKVLVGKRRVEATPAIEDVAYGASLRWAFAYSPAIPDGDSQELEELARLAGYALYDAEGHLAHEGIGLLPGQYAVKAKKTEVETEKYILTVKDQAQLTVKPVEGMAALSAVVKDEGGRLLGGAAVEVAGQRLLTDSKGECVAAVAHGVYVARVTRGGYQPYCGTVEVQTPSLAREFVLRAVKHTLRYSVGASGGGVIYGALEQHVADGATGEPVEAIAREGYRFVAWSDGLASARRVDQEVDADIAVDAHFEKVVSSPVYTVTYRIKGSGVFADGGIEDRVYELREGDEIPTVNVAPANAMSYFVSWSDGVKELARPAGQKVTGSITLTAEFRSMAHLPFQENFERDGIPAQWRVDTEYPDPTCRWKVFKGTVPMIGIPIPSRAATIIACEKLSDNPVLYSSSLRLPLLDVSGLAGNLKVEFDWMYMNAEDKFALSYAVDGGVPVELWAKASGVEQGAFDAASLEIPNAVLAGKKTVEFIFSYRSTEFSWFAAVDNISIYETPSPDLSITLLSEPSGKATFSSAGHPVESFRVQAGSVIPHLDVHPAEGYAFKEWRIDGSPISPSEYGKVCRSLVAVAVLTNVNGVAISYGVEPPHGGDVMMNGRPITCQNLEKGGEAEAVVAMPRAGYVFSHWADNGSQKAERAGEVARSDARYTAIFRPLGAVVALKASDIDNSGPLPGVRVALTDAHGAVSIYYTGANGEVRVELPYGDYSYSASLQGYEPVEKSRLRVSRDSQKELVQLRREAQKVAFDVFVCDAESGAPLAGADVRMGVVSVLSGEDGLAHFSLLPASYLYAASCKNYRSVTDAIVEVPYSDGRLRIALRKEKAVRGVEFVVSDGRDSKPLAGATVRVGTLAVVTGLAGKASLRLTEGDHSYSAQGEGYAEASGRFSVSAPVLPIEIRLEPRRYTVVLAVRNAWGKPIQNAKVTLGGEAKRTSEDGTVDFSSLAAGEYTYSIARDGCIPIEGKKIFVISSDRRIVEVMEYTGRDLTVAVSSGGQSVPNASVTFVNGKGTSFGPFVTGADGTLPCNLVPGHYSYEVLASGREAKRAAFHFVDQEALLIDFGRRAIDISCQKPANGSIELRAGGRQIINRATIYEGCRLAITAVPNAHYRLEALVINGVPRAESFIGIEAEEDLAISARFTPITHPVTFTVVSGKGSVIVRAGGSALPSGADVDEGATVQVEAIPDEGFALAYLRANGEEVTKGGGYVVNAPTRIEAAFEELEKTAVEDAELVRVTVSPNPFVAEVMLGNAMRVERYTIVSSRGVEVLRGMGNGAESIRIATRHFAPGVYVLTIYRAGAQRQMLIVKPF